jgi:hypothetical protein
MIKASPTLLDRLRAAQWEGKKCRHEFNLAIGEGAPVHILEMIEEVARLCGEAAAALAQAQARGAKLQGILPPDCESTEERERRLK